VHRPEQINPHHLRDAARMALETVGKARETVFVGHELTNNSRKPQYPIRS
jgi:hypothetical protein